nr:MAG TPA: hypothetical protein [Caudoviricetes sp.]
MLSHLLFVISHVILISRGPVPLHYFSYRFWK